MAVDQVVKAATGTSLTDRIMQPLMEHVLKPMIEGISKLVTGLLEACGVSKEDAEMAGNIIGAVVGMALMAAVVIGAMVLGKSSQAQKLLKPMLKMAEKMIAKLIPQVLKEAGAEGAAMLSKGISRLTSGLKNTGNKVLNSVDEQLPDGLKNAGKNVYSKMGGRSGIGNTMQRGANGMSMVSAVATGATSGVIADSQKKLDKLKALIDKLMAQDALDSDFTSGMLKHVKALMAMLDSIDSSMSEVINADTSRSNFILNNLSGHAA
jgi:invasin B